MTNVDETPNIRTVLVHQEAIVGVETLQVDIFVMTIKTLTEYIVKELSLKAPMRIRNLTNGTLYAKEEEDMLLTHF